MEDKQEEKVCGGEDGVGVIREGRLWGVRGGDWGGAGAGKPICDTQIIICHIPG